MADHTYCYTPAVLKIRELVAEGELGEILFVDSVRINLGLVQPDVDVFWDLAPHDLSILDFVLPGRPRARRRRGASAPTRSAPAGPASATLTLPLPGGALAHVHVNWLSPTKIRQMVIGGSRRTLVWDDLNPQQRLSVYDRGRRPRPSTVGRRRRPRRASHRSPTAWATPGRPALPEREALGRWSPSSPPASARAARRAPTVPAGLRVLSVLEPRPAEQPGRRRR